MKKHEVKAGRQYLVKLRGQFVTVKVDEIRVVPGQKHRTGWGYNKRTHYCCTNLKTGRKVRFHSASKFRKEVNKPTVTTETVTLTPATAEALLGGSNSNRPLKEAMVNQFVQDLTSVPYQFVPGQPVTVGLNPQHFTVVRQVDDKVMLSNRMVFDVALVNPVQGAAGVNGSLREQGEAMLGRHETEDEETPDPEEDYPPQPVKKSKGGKQCADPTVLVGTEYPPRPLLKPTKGLAERLDSLADRISARHKAALANQGEAPSITPPEKGGLADVIGERSGKLVNTDRPHVIARARAGTGKTWMMLKGIGYMRGIKAPFEPSPQQWAVWEEMYKSRLDANKVAFCAFNKSIATNIEEQMPPGCDAMTIHKMGCRAVLRAFNLNGREAVNKHKVGNLVSEFLGIDYREMRTLRPGLVSSIREIVSMVKMRLVGVNEKDRYDGKSVNWPEEIHNIVSYYDIDVVQDDEEDIYQLVPKIMERCLDPKRDGCIDFDDMVWLPIVCKGVKIWPYDLLCVDEAQDLNPAQQRFVFRAGKRLIVVGDDRQAIYGFTGGDVDGLAHQQIALQDTSRGCVLLPLTVTRRCGRAIVEEAKKIVPDFEAHENNGPGVVSSAMYPIQQSRGYWAKGTRKLEFNESYLKDVKPGDMVICRVNSHLILQCSEHHRRGQRASILGRNVGDGIIDLIEKLEAKTIPDLVSMVTDWQARETEKENARRNPSDNRLLTIQTRAESVLVLCEQATNLLEFRKKVDELFTDNPHLPGVLHASIHKCKGLEARHVHFLMPKGGQCPHPMAKTDWQRRQEQNMLYVGETRAIEELTFVR